MTILLLRDQGIGLFYLFILKKSTQIILTQYELNLPSSWNKCRDIPLCWPGRLLAYRVLYLRDCTPLLELAFDQGSNKEISEITEKNKTRLIM